MAAWNLLGVTSIFLSCLCLSCGRISEYQLESETLSQCELLRRDRASGQHDYIPQCSEDGRYRHVQCGGGSGECWCVNAEGKEVPQSRLNASAVYCLTSCQLARQEALVQGDARVVPVCSNSGDYHPVQCDHMLGQCWCVDLEGMEIYGTRQNGEPSRCPGSCEVRERRLLHGVGDSSPPQCSADGNFLPVQCKFINTTNMKVIDLLHTFNRFPEAFQTFSAFRKLFPEMSSYCFCADSRGRELANTGVELLLDDVYDTAFSGMSVRSFSQSNMYRILQRRFLAILLVMSGRFRCLTKCERERSSALQAGNIFVPTCDKNGAYKPAQCQLGGQCWCVDSHGSEIFGTRQLGGMPDCRTGVRDCLSERRQALSTLFSGPGGPFSQLNVFTMKESEKDRIPSPFNPYSQEYQELFAQSGLVSSLPDSEEFDFGGILAEVTQGLFPTGAMALKALALSVNPKRLQENLFGGKFLKNVGNLNFTGAVGPRGTFNVRQLLNQFGLIKSSGDVTQLANTFSPETDFRPENLSLEQEIQDYFGRPVNLRKNQNIVKLLGLTLENEQFLDNLRDIIILSNVEDSSELGGLFQAVFQISQSGSGVAGRTALFIPRCTDRGQFEDTQCQGQECWCVDSRGTEVPGSRSAGRRARCPSQCEREHDAAVKVQASKSAGSQVFIPKCESDGRFARLQCSGQACFCVDSRDGKSTAFTVSHTGPCPSDCQAKAALRFVAAVRSLLWSPSAVPRLSDIYVPRCDAIGGWHQVQCDGPSELAFQFYQQWVTVNNAGKEMPLSELIGTLRGYGRKPGAMASFRGFVQELFSAGHQRVFPSLSRYAEFSDVPLAVLEGDPEVVTGPTVFLDPLALWQLLHENVSAYPGELSDFSAPLGHFELRQCWCVDENGDVIPDTEAAVGQVPKCPGPCTRAARQVSQFLKQADGMISSSSSSHVPLGYSFLLAEGLSFTQEELQVNFTEGLLSERLLSLSDYALHLAAYSTLHSSWRSGQEGNEAFRLGYQPYSPQCDAYGQWVPTQCYYSTGQCWCVSEDGHYVPGSLDRRSWELLTCGTPCQRAETKALISDWIQSGSDPSVQPVPLYIPLCQEDGEFSVLQTAVADSNESWCVSPSTGRAIQPASRNQNGDPQCPSWCELLRGQVTQREAGLGYKPECQLGEQLFSPVQCDQESCWCVSYSGQELPGTRTDLSTGRQPSCNAPQCPYPFEDVSIARGVVLCEDVLDSGQRTQQCRLSCHQGYVNTLAVPSFLCDVVMKKWLAEAPLPQGCQRPQGLQFVMATSILQVSLSQGQKACSSQQSELKLSLLKSLRAKGLCTLQMYSSGVFNSLSVCDDSSVELNCLSDEQLKVQITRGVRLSDVAVEALPDLHDIDVAFSTGRLRDGLLNMLQSDVIFSPDSAVLTALAVNFTCSPGYLRIAGVSGCVPCPAGTLFSSEVCSPCPRGSYQDQEGKVYCKQCPAGTSTVSKGAFRAAHCVTECQKSSLTCTEEGRFRDAQQDVQTQSWFCVMTGGRHLPWTLSVEALTDQDCQVMEKFESVPRAQWVLGAEDAVILNSQVSDKQLGSGIRECVLDCAKDEFCHHLVLFTEEGQTHCDSYSAVGVNVQCQASGQTKGFLGNPGADMYQNLSCLLKVKGGNRQDLVVLRKKGHEFSTKSEKTFERQAFMKVGSGSYRTVVFQAEGATLTDVHRFCLDACSKESCCDGFILNKNIFDGGTIMCGLLSNPDTLMCSDADWDANEPGETRQACGSGLKYSKLRKQFTFSLGGQNFTINSDLTTRQNLSSCSSVPPQQFPRVSTSDALKEEFSAIENGAVLVDSGRDVPRLEYRIFKWQYAVQQAELWCLARCKEVEVCHLADVRDESPISFTCLLYPNTQVCGAYDKPLRQACSPVLPLAPLKAYRKKVSLTGSVKNFYTRVPFKKMVSYSVRSRVNVTSRPMTDGFFECERRCDEDPCCRGIGFISDSQTPGTDKLCLTLNSLGVQTCGEDERTRWRVMDCSPSKVETELFPFGWYEKPVNQWTKSPKLCPPFQLAAPLLKVNVNVWDRLDVASALIDPSLSVYDVIHISKDVAEDLNRSRDWCLSACMMSEACRLVTIQRRESAVRCLLYPDTHACVPAAGANSCRVLIKEPALYLYLRKDSRSELKSVFIQGHGNIVGEFQAARIGPESKRVVQFLGVPYARPPVRALRFKSPQTTDWKGSWNATFARPSCLQPGDTESPIASEDCLYLNVFVPVSIRGNASVMVFFHNFMRGVTGDGPMFLDGSYLAAVGNVIVVTASFRAAAFGFLSTGSTDSSGNYGLQDQAAALRWVQKNIAYFGGDPGRVTLGADRSGADVASLHLISTETPRYFHRALLMGGSVFSPASVMNSARAQQQAVSLAQELGCPSSDAAQMLSCLRGVPAQALNAAQTKLLSVSGPLQAWAPVVDGIYVKESPFSAMQKGHFHHMDLLVGPSAEDGLISRAKNIKRFEELQGRVDGKTAFYKALSNSLGGENANPLVKEAATWFYSMQHEPSPAGYNVFSRALENATRDLFIICPVVKMAAFWAAHTRSNVFMYYLPEKTAQTSVDLSVPLDIQYLFGLPYEPQTKETFTTAERRLSLQVMNYVANFVKSGNPNNPHSYSKVSFGEILPPWPSFKPHLNRDNYKEMHTSLSNQKGLKKAECSFWHDYIPALTLRTDKLVRGFPEEAPVSTPNPDFTDSFQTSVGPSKPKAEKDAYN